MSVYEDGLASEQCNAHDGKIESGSDGGHRAILDICHMHFMRWRVLKKSDWCKIESRSDRGRPTARNAFSAG